MAASDISQLGELRPIEPLDLDNYKDNQELPNLPKAGVYTFQAPDTFPPAERSKKSGAALVQIDPKIVGPSTEGYQVRFVKISAKEFKRGQKPVSQMGDYLRACGVTGKFSDEQALLQAIDGTANQTFQAEVDWKVWNKATQTETLGMDKFPSDGNGGHEPYLYTGEKDENGNPIRLRANLTITRFIPASDNV